MARYLSLLKPEINTVVLDNEVSEKVTYLDIPLKLDLKDLSSDIKSGAGQFNELKTLIEKENEPQYILITTDNLEQGYMAVTYLQAAFNEKHGDICDCDEDYCQEDLVGMEEWIENNYRIPIIEETALRQSISAYNDPYLMNNVFMLGNQNGLNKRPYWMDCIYESVCIVSKNQGFDFGFAGTASDVDPLYEGLKLFSQNTKVYIINIQTETTWDTSFYDAEEDDDEIFEDHYRSKWNYIILSFSADEVNVKLKKEQINTYYKVLLKSVIKSKGYDIKKGFSAEKVVNKIVKMMDCNKCKLTENIVSYATKDWSASQREISNKDFDFMERFIRTMELKRNRKTINAKTELQNKLIGMERIKEQVLDIVNVMKYNKMRVEMNISGRNYHNVHLMLGAPGTAKTTVAKLMGQIMMEEKLLPDNRFTCVNGAELKGMYVGHSAPKTKALFEENDIIVIDEAYSLVGDNGSCDSFSKEAIAQLIIELENHSTDKLVIFAGYGGKNVSEQNNKMKDFLDANPGIRSRITSTIYFDSYSPEEMASIFFQLGKNQNYQIDLKVKELIINHFQKRVLDDNFGNGREARSLLETSIVFAAKRIFRMNKKSYSKADMQTITFEDVQKAIIHVETGEMAQNVHQKQKIGFCI